MYLHGNRIRTVPIKASLSGSRGDGGAAVWRSDFSRRRQQIRLKTVSLTPPPSLPSPARLPPHPRRQIPHGTRRPRHVILLDAPGATLTAGATSPNRTGYPTPNRFEVVPVRVTRLRKSRFRLFLLIQ
ncbi:hypothetical protein H6P81_019164 [Aristolochia fimbriata]|uniref:Uncharacterized protein n=1 Tax=Aristolochia fimbriata TaxID=158543 RepID=A0AAV7DSL7_ARIFI|nr:hypothetical protein H6P81_019164 [Aristolochia fimbriata]